MISLAQPESFQEYLRNLPEPSPGDLVVFPLVDETTKMPPKRLREKMLRDRFRWLRAMYSSTDPADLYTMWSDPEFFLRERRACKEQQLLDFFRNSYVFAIHLLQEEPDSLYYLRILRDSLRLRVQAGEPVCFVGPTSGAELEAIVSAGGDPVLVADDSKWAHLCEERMLDNRLPFESLAPRDFVRNPFGAKYVVLSKWLQNPFLHMKNAYRALGLCGFVFFPATNLSMAEAAESLDLRPIDENQNAVCGWFKHPGLPVEISGDE